MKMHCLSLGSILDRKSLIAHPETPIWIFIFPNCAWLILYAVTSFPGRDKMAIFSLDLVDQHLAKRVDVLQ